MRVAPSETTLYRQPAYRILDGLTGGIIGGVLMGMVSMVLFPLLAIGGFWQPMNLISGVISQGWGLIAGFSPMPVLIGMMLHLTLSAVLGGIFAWIASRTVGNAVLKAVVASLLIWAVAGFLVLPWVNPIMSMIFPQWLFALAHVMYGLGLGFYLAWRGRQADELVVTTDVDSLDAYRAADDLDRRAA
jgi:hypothetical protein